MNTHTYYDIDIDDIDDIDDLDDIDIDIDIDTRMFTVRSPYL